jgi:uncharacterized protein
VVLFGLPVIALLLGLIFGGSLHTADLGPVLIKQLGSILLAVVVINLWEETVWAGFPNPFGGPLHLRRGRRSDGMGVMMHAALDSVLAVGILHQIFDASNNNGALVDSVLDGADAGNMTQLAAAILTILIAAWLLWRRPGAFAKRHAPLPELPPEADP